MRDLNLKTKRLDSDQRASKRIDRKQIERGKTHDNHRNNVNNEQANVSIEHS